MDSKPSNPGSVIIKPGHEHSEGLKAAFLFNDGGDSVYDWTKGGNDLSVVGGASWVDDGMQFDASGEYAKLDNTDQIVNSEAGTVILRLKSLSAFVDSTTRGYFGNVISAGANGFGLFKLSNNLYFWLNDGASTHYISFNSSNFPTWQTDIQIAILWDRQNAIFNSDNLVLNINGVHTAPNASSGETGWNTFTVKNILSIGNDYSDLTKFSNSVCKYSYIYDEVLEEGALEGVFNNPYDMFMTPTLPKGVKISYATGATEFKETLVLNDHAHSENLVASYPFKKAYNLRYSYNDDYSSKNNRLDTMPSAMGSSGLHCGISGEYSYLDNSNEPINIDEGTIVLYFTSWGTLPTQCLFGRYTPYGAGDFTIMKYTDSRLYFLLNDGVNDHYVAINISSIANWTWGVQIAVLWRRTSAIWNSDNMVINIDGNHITPVTSSNETSWVTGSLAAISYYIGNNSANTSHNANGPIERFDAYNTVLTETQLQSIMNDPYAKFRK